MVRPPGREAFDAECVCPVSVGSPDKPPMPLGTSGNSGFRVGSGEMQARAGLTFGGSGELHPRFGGSPAGSGELRPLFPGTRSPLGSGELQPRGGPFPRGSGELTPAPECAFPGEDLSLPSSPAHSAFSDRPDSESGRALSASMSPAQEEQHQRQRRASFDNPQAPHNRMERRGFLGKNQTHLMTTPPRASGPFDSPTRAVGPTPLFAGSPCGGFVPGVPLADGGAHLYPGGRSHSAESSPMRTQGVASPSPLFQAYAPQAQGGSPDSTRQARAAQGTGSPAYPGRPTGLREHVLLRSTSGQSADLAEASAEDEECQDPDPSAVCLNFTETETACEERELEKDTVDGVLIVPLPSSLAMGGSKEQYVHYALFFSSQDSTPVLPGDQSTKLLFPKKLQDAANWPVMGQDINDQKQHRNIAFDCKPFQPPSSRASTARPVGTPLALFPSYNSGTGSR